MLSLRLHPDNRMAEHWSLHRLTVFECKSKTIQQTMFRWSKHLACCIQQNNQQANILEVTLSLPQNEPKCSILSIANIVKGCPFSNHMEMQTREVHCNSVELQCKSFLLHCNGLKIILYTSCALICKHHQKYKVHHKKGTTWFCSVRSKI